MEAARDGRTYHRNIGQLAAWPITHTTTRRRVRYDAAATRNPHTDDSDNENDKKIKATKSVPSILAMIVLPLVVASF